MQRRDQWRQGKESSFKLRLIAVIAISGFRQPAQNAPLQERDDNNDADSTIIKIFLAPLY